jgi:alpha-ketoglutarate-dependent 2,4-dichlorophenoxyacetate dioxygenase
MNVSISPRDMNVSISPSDSVNHPDFFGHVEGIDLREPLTESELGAIVAGLDHYGVLAFPQQSLTDAQQLAFSQRLGSLEVSTEALSAEARGEGSKLRLAQQITDISNVSKTKMAEGVRMARLLNAQVWHSDSAHRLIPAKYTILSARAIPSKGGNTEFADMRTAYDALPDDTKAIVADLVVVNDVRYIYQVLGFTEDDFKAHGLEQFGPVQHRLVRRHPGSERKALYLSSQLTTIRDWPLVEARRLLRDLMEHATQRQFVYAHVWSKYDLLIWDNRVTMHRGLRYDETQVRDLHRTILSDDGPTVEQRV